MESTAQPNREGTIVVAATVWRWKPTNGTGVLKTDDDGKYVWFHVSHLDGLKYAEVHEGLPVELSIDWTPQDKFECRAEHVSPRSPLSSP